MKKLLLIGISLIASLSAAAQSYVLSGQVTSAADGQPLPGVTVTVAGTAKGTITMPDGKFTIAVENGQTLRFSYLGYAEQQVAVTAQNDLNITMEYDATQLEELVVIGYGTMKKSDLTGAVGSVKGDVLKKSPVASVTQALQGRVAGVTVTSNTGQPGSDVSVRIRGVGSVHAGVSPLYVVDGMIVDDINFLSPNDIESTEVLKDASAASIYGSRAANGVILITTKSGAKNERMNISFDAYAGIQNRWNKLDLMGSDEHIQTYFKINETSQAEKNAFRDGGLNGWLDYARIGGVPDFPVATNVAGQGFNYATQDTDWQDAVFRCNAVIQNYHLSLDGGSDKLTYALSANYFSQDGTIMGSSYERINVRLNTSYQARKWLRVGETLNFSTTKSRWSLNNHSQPGASVLSAALAMAPWDPTHYPAGSLNIDGEDLGGRISAASNFKNVVNPFSMEAHSHPRDNDERWVGSLYVDITPFKGFTFHSDMSFDINNSRRRSFLDAYYYSGEDSRAQNSVGQSMGRSSRLIFNNYGTYARTIGKHEFSAMAGHTVEMSKNESVGVGGANLLNTDERFWSLSYATTDLTQGGSYNGEFRRMSVMGRLHYAFDNRYLLTFNWRSDANQAFRNNLWAHFPSVAAAWKINEESFLSDVKDVSLLKLRLGWGRLGNDAVGSDIFTQVMYSSQYTFTGYPLGPGTGDSQNLSQGAAVLSQRNLSGRWEVTQHWNAGVDFGFWQNRLSGSVDLFIRDTKDMLLSNNWPKYAGVLFAAVDNIGTMRNKGIEFTLEHQNNVRTSLGPLFYSVSGNISFIKNSIIDMNGADPVWGDKTVTNQNLAVWSFWGYKYQGIFRTQDEVDSYFGIQKIPAGATAEEKAAIEEANALRNKHGFGVGDARYADLSGDRELDDQQDMTVIGNPFPKFTYGINLSVEWVGFDLQLFFQGVYGNKIYNALRERTEGNAKQAHLSTAMRDVWTADTPDGSIPNPLHSFNYWQSDRFIEDGSYFRLKNMQLGYSIPMKATQKIGIQRLRVYLAASNLFTVTKYTGYDPEVGGGVDYGNYPQSRTFMLGVNINF